MGPVREEEEEKDDGIPKVLCQMDNHLGMLTLSLLVATTFSCLRITFANSLDPDQDRQNVFVNSFLASSDFSRLLITCANSLDQDQDRQNVGPDLDQNCLTL